MTENKTSLLTLVAARVNQIIVAVIMVIIR